MKTLKKAKLRIIVAGEAEKKLARVRWSDLVCWYQVTANGFFGLPTEEGLKLEAQYQLDRLKLERR